MLVDEPLVSIIMPAYNCERFIFQTITSVIQQTYKNWELIICDDCSTDKTPGVISRFSDIDSRIKYYRMEANVGVAKARNFAIGMAHGKYIAFLDSDDIWKPEKLQMQIAFMQENQVGFSFAKYQRITEVGQPLGTPLKTPRSVNYKQLLKGNCIGCLTVVVRREVLGDLLFPQKGHEDYILWLRILKTRNICAYSTGECLAYYRVSKKSLSSNKLRACRWMWAIYRHEEELSILMACLFFFSYAFNGAVRRLSVSS